MQGRPPDAPPLPQRRLCSRARQRGAADLQLNPAGNGRPLRTGGNRGRRASDQRKRHPPHRREPYLLRRTSWCVRSSVVHISVAADGITLVEGSGKVCVTAEDRSDLIGQSFVLRAEDPSGVHASLTKTVGGDLTVSEKFDPSGPAGGLQPENLQQDPLLPGGHGADRQRPRSGSGQPRGRPVGRTTSSTTPGWTTPCRSPAPS